MGRLIVLIVIVVAAVWLLRRALRAAQAKDEPAGQAGPKASQAELNASQELVRCAHCGLLLPRGEARMAAGAIYCGEEHARLGAGRGPGAA
jgi:uncharacterized protein